MFEGYIGFADYVKRYGLQRSEGVLLRYLSQLYKTLDQSVPRAGEDRGGAGTPSASSAPSLEHTDTSLLEEWESLLHPELRLRTRARAGDGARGARGSTSCCTIPSAFAARVRAEMHLLVRALADTRLGGGGRLGAAGPRRPETVWDAERFEAGAGAVLRRVRRAGLHPRGPPPPLDADPRAPATARGR